MTQCTSVPTIKWLFFVFAGVMLLKLHFFLIISLSILCGENVTSQKESKWLKNLVKYLDSKSKRHQVAFLVPDRISDLVSKAESVVRAITERVSSLSLTLNDISHSTGRYPTLENNPRRTTIFILILDAASEESFSTRVLKQTEFLARLAKHKSRPKCLIMHLLKERCFTYKTLLQNLWAKRFLDATVVETLKVDEATKDKGLKGILNSRKEMAILHHFNPFNKDYNRQKWSSKSQWFPDKTRNFHGYALRTISVDATEPKKLAWITDLVPKSMNVTWNVIRSSGYQMACLKNQTKNLNDLFENKAQILNAPMFKGIICEPAEDFYLPAEFIMLHTYNAVVPRILHHRIAIMVTKKIMYTLLVVGILIIALPILTSICKLDKKFWEPIHVFQMIIGMEVPVEVKNVRDRMIFGSALITYLIYSSYLFSVLEEFAVDMGHELSINTIEDLDKSGLIPIVSQSIRVTAKSQGNLRHFEEVLKKVREYSKNYTVDQCLHDAIEHKNVSCSMLMRMAHIMIHEVLKKASQDIKLMDQSLLDGFFMWMLEPESPYFHWFSQLLQGSLENGLLTNTLKKQSMAINPSSEGTEAKKLQYQLISMLIIGNLLALIAFVGEIIGSYLSKKRLRRSNWRLRIRG